MAKKVTAIRAAKQSKSDLHPFRVVVRGTLGTGKKARRVRKVFTTMAADEASAAQLAQPRIDKECKALQNVYLNVFAPLTSCDEDPEDTISYTNVNAKVGFIAVYAGDSLEQAQQFLAVVKQNGRFPGANLRRMQAVLGYP